jgi:hypothetical protein
MKLPQIICSLAMIFFQVGCAHNHLSRGANGVPLVRGQGDVGRFIFEKAIQCDCAPIKTNPPPLTLDQWYYREEKKGILIAMRKNSFPEIVAFLDETFGPPTLGTEDMGDGWKYGEHRFGPEDGWIEFIYGSDRTQVVIMRSMKKWEDLQ